MIATRTATNDARSARLAARGLVPVRVAARALEVSTVCVQQRCARGEYRAHRVGHAIYLGWEEIRAAIGGAWPVPRTAAGALERWPRENDEKPRA